jgi:GNAT superfamily N-acetyltransferase
MNDRSARQVRVLGRDEIEPYIPVLAALRVTVFRDFPYLYDGSDAYERDYLSHYAASERAVVVLASDAERVVGCSTGLPLCDADAEFRAPFERHGPDPATVFYFGESVLLPEYRGLGIGHRFFDAREAHAEALGFAVTAFCAVDRSPDDPRRPPNYRPLDDFWTRRGYVRQPGLQAHFCWKEIDREGEQPHRLTFWLRDA